MTLFNFIDNGDGKSIGILNTKLTEKQVIKLEQKAQDLYDKNDHEDFKSSYFDELIKEKDTSFKWLKIKELDW